MGSRRLGSARHRHEMAAVVITNDHLLAVVNGTGRPATERLAEAEALRAQARDLLGRAVHLEEEARVIDQVDVVYDGVALTTRWGRVRAVDDTTGRSAKIYESAHTPGVWRVRAELCDPSTCASPSGWAGGRVNAEADRASEREAEIVAGDWVVHGIYPGL